jgi:hypothetical protein
VYVYDVGLVRAPASRIEITQGAPLSNSRLLAAAAAVAGVVLIVIAVVYFAEPAKSLPSFFPGHQAGSGHHHTKHGIAALALGLAALAFAWFQTGPKSRSEAS